MTWLTEDPTLLLVAAGVIAAGLLVAFFRTGRGVYLLWLGAVILATMICVGIERYVVTDREMVEETLNGAASAVEANDVDQTLAYVANDAVALREEIRSRLPRLRIEEVRMADVTIDFSPLELPPKAIARFLGIAKFKADGVPYDRVLRPVTVRLVKQNDRWLVESYELRQRRL
jgi:hypothetical protein